ncbi:MAG TPA: 2-dehydropantoate 2-reductase [Solirubrobacteraceae bacterium]|nr:2-dehydropantoate 2-reductase [Solirubrobacteraceae bacterium]
MRFVVLGAGAIGGTVGARLHERGHDVWLIARGAHLQALQRDGLELREPGRRAVLRIPALGAPGELRWRGDEIVLVATKSQDTGPALAALRSAAPPSVAVVCLQNGVENERVALRLFERVYAAAVMLPAAHLKPGVVLCYGTALTGMIDLGRYPGSVDALCGRLCEALCSCGIQARAVADIQRAKHAKLVANLANVVEALCAPGADRDLLAERTRAEGRSVLRAAGIPCEDPEVSDLRGRMKRIGVGEIDGAPRPGSSTWQSLARRSGALETDHLNGEIVLRARLAGVPAPLNELLCRLAARAVAQGLGPGALAAGEILADGALEAA